VGCHTAEAHLVTEHGGCSTPGPGYGLVAPTSRWSGTPAASDEPDVSDGRAARPQRPPRTAPAADQVLATTANRAAVQYTTARTGASWTSTRPGTGSNQGRGQDQGPDRHQPGPDQNRNHQLCARIAPPPGSRPGTGSPPGSGRTPRPARNRCGLLEARGHRDGSPNSREINRRRVPRPTPGRSGPGARSPGP